MATNHSSLITTITPLITKAQTFSFNFSTTFEELNESFNTIGKIFAIILESKLNENFYNILYRLKPIEDIDKYMLNFNFEKDVALRQNSDLGLIVEFWLEDSSELKAESESSLKNITKIEDFVKLMDQQEKDFSTTISNTIEIINKPIDIQTNESTSIETIPTLVKSENDIKPTEELKIESKLTLNINGKDEEYSIAGAMSIIKEAKEYFVKHFFATETLRHCIEVLSALNESNRVKISRWSLTEKAINLRNQLWTKRSEVQTNKKIEKK